MGGDVDQVISALRAHFGATSDAELARRLRIDKSTVSSWRARGSVPGRFKEILDGGSHQFVLTSPIKWGEHESYAFRLALLRFTRLAAQSVSLSDYRECLSFFDGEAQAVLWMLMDQAQKDLAELSAELPLHTALAVAIHDDLAAPEAAIDRDRVRLGAVAPRAER